MRRKLPHLAGVDRGAPGHRRALRRRPSRDVPELPLPVPLPGGDARLPPLHGARAAPRRPGRAPEGAPASAAASTTPCRSTGSRASPKPGPRPAPCPTSSPTEVRLACPASPASRPTSRTRVIAGSARFYGSVGGPRAERRAHVDAAWTSRGAAVGRRGRRRRAAARNPLQDRASECPPRRRHVACFPSGDAPLNRSRRPRAPARPAPSRGGSCVPRSRRAVASRPALRHASWT